MSDTDRDTDDTDDRQQEPLPASDQAPNAEVVLDEDLDDAEPAEEAAEHVERLERHDDR
ncbi:MAG TPA: hypothetical protein VIL48_09975 [Acidimicrobiales bacterium]